MATTSSPHHSTSQSRFMGIAFSLLAAIGFSAKAILVKLAYVYPVDTVTLLALRMGFSLPIFLFLAIWLGVRQDSVSLDRKDWFAVISLGLLGYYLSSLLDFLGLQYISASLERLILFLYPTLVIVLSALFFGHKIGRRAVLAFALSYAGIVLVFLHDMSTTQKGMLLGSLLVFASTFTYALYLIGAGQTIAKIGAMRFMAYAMTVACLATLLQFAMIHSFATLRLPHQVYELGIAMAIFSTILPGLFLAAGIRRIGSGHASLVGSVGPVATMFMAYTILGESISALQIAGSMLVLAGVLTISVS